MKKPKASITKAAATAVSASQNHMLKLFIAARNAAAPLIAIQTPDPQATIHTIAEGLNGDLPPIFVWDCMRAFSTLNEHDRALLNCINSPSTLIRPDEALAEAIKLPEDAILFLMNAQRHVCDREGCDNTSAIQAAWNLRDHFKSNGRMLVLLAPHITLPGELSNDTLVVDEPLPDSAQLLEITKELYSTGDNPIPLPSPDMLAKIVDAVTGLAAFPAEQAVAMSLSKAGIDLDALWERKRQMVEQTRGLTVWRGGSKFSNIGGLENIKNFLRRIIAGKKRPRVIVFVDEIEKSINPDGDLSGVQKDQLGQLLSFMQDNEAAGLILIGPPGTCKSELAKAAGNEAEVPTVVLDLGGMKAGIVGESEGNIRNGLKVCKAIGDNRLLFIATCNSIGSLPPELRRRFTLGTFFLDLPPQDERREIWDMYVKKFGVRPEHAALPADEGWTGAEIRQCCDLADSLDIPLREASDYIVPVATSASEKINALRQQASGRYISASKPGLYVMPTESAAPSAPPPTGRRIRRPD